MTGTKEGRGDITLALAVALFAAVLILTVVYGNLLNDNASDIARLELQIIEADEREVKMAKRLIVLTENWNDAAEMLAVLTDACEIDGWCVEVATDE